MSAPLFEIRYTERAMLDLLARRYDMVAGNGQRYVCAEHMRDRAAFDATRTADLIVQDLWPSSGFQIIGHEVKVSRSDWLTELKCPEKSLAFRRYVDRWWLVVPDKTIVRNDLPAGWGLMAVQRGKLRAIKTAPLLTPEPMPRSMQVAMLRAAAKTAERNALRPSVGPMRSAS